MRNGVECRVAVPRAFRGPALPIRPALWNKCTGMMARIAECCELGTERLKLFSEGSFSRSRLFRKSPQLGVYPHLNFTYAQRLMRLEGAIWP